MKHGQAGGRHFLNVPGTRSKQSLKKVIQMHLLLILHGPREICCVGQSSLSTRRTLGRPRDLSGPTRLMGSGGLSQGMHTVSGPTLGCPVPDGQGPSPAPPPPRTHMALGSGFLQKEPQSVSFPPYCFSLFPPALQLRTCRLLEEGERRKKSPSRECVRSASAHGASGEDIAGTQEEPSQEGTFCGSPGTFQAGSESCGPQAGGGPPTWAQVCQVLLHSVTLNFSLRRGSPEPPQTTYTISRQALSPRVGSATPETIGAFDLAWQGRGGSRNFLGEYSSLLYGRLPGWPPVIPPPGRSHPCHHYGPGPSLAANRV